MTKYQKKMVLLFKRIDELDKDMAMKIYHEIIDLIKIYLDNENKDSTSN